MTEEAQQRAIFSIHKRWLCIYFVAGRKWFGLAKRLEYRHPVFGPDCPTPESIAAVRERVRKGGKGALFEIKYEGTLSEPGRYGQYGINRQITLHRIEILRSTEDK